MTRLPSLTISVDEYLNDSLEQNARYSAERMVVYALRDGELVFYVGRTGHAVRRLSQHIGDLYDRANVSRVGWLIRDNLPDSLLWSIDLYTYADWGCLNATLAERRAIRTFRPCLNVAMNPEPSPLPRKYQREEMKWRKNVADRSFSMDALQANVARR